MSRAMVPWAGPVNAMPRNIDDNTSGQPREKSRKIQEKIIEILMKMQNCY